MGTNTTAFASKLVYLSPAINFFNGLKLAMVSTSSAANTVVRINIGFRQSEICICLRFGTALCYQMQIRRIYITICKGLCL